MRRSSLLLLLTLLGVNAFGQSSNQEPAYLNLYRLIEEAAILERVNPMYLAVIVRLETGSKPDPCRFGKAGEIGITQVMPSTRNHVVGSYYDLHKPKLALVAGARYLRRQLDMTSNISLAFAAYNGGPKVLTGTMKPSTRMYMKSAERFLELAKKEGWKSLFDTSIVRNANARLCVSLLER